MVNYPAQIDNSLSIPASVDNNTPVTASVTNRLRDAIIAIESELGVKPGGVSTVKARFATIELALENLDIIGGDIGGTTSSPLVIGLQGQPLSDDEPTLNDVLTWNGLAWAPGPITFSSIVDADISASAAISVSKLAAGTNTYVLTTTGGVPVWAAPTTFTAGGDLSGTSSSQTVSKVNGTTITTAGGALAVGAVLRTTAAGVADWGTVDLADTDAVTGVLPTGNIATTLSSKTLSSPTITGTVTYQGTRLRILSIPAELQTTDDTVTTIASFAMVDETLCAFDVIVTAALQGSVTDGGRWKRSVVYRRTGAGVPLIVGTLESGTDQEVTAGLDVTIDDDGVDTIRVRVTGVAATNFNWTAELRVQETLATA